MLQLQKQAVFIHLQKLLGRILLRQAVTLQKLYGDQLVREKLILDALFQIIDILLMDKLGALYVYPNRASIPGRGDLFYLCQA